MPTPFTSSSHRPVSIKILNSFNSSIQLFETSNPRRRTAMKEETHLIFFLTVAVKEKIWLTFSGFLSVLPSTQIPRLSRKKSSSTRSLLINWKHSTVKTIIGPLIDNYNVDVSACKIENKMNVRIWWNKSINSLLWHFSMIVKPSKTFKFKILSFITY